MVTLQLRSKRARGIHVYTLHIINQLRGDTDLPVFALDRQTFPDGILPLFLFPRVAEHIGLVTEVQLLKSVNKHILQSRRSSGQRNTISVQHIVIAYTQFFKRGGGRIELYRNKETCSNKLSVVFEVFFFQIFSHCKICKIAQ